jgi:peroxiredoxin Q/BCP
MVSLDDPEKNKAFAESLDGNFPLLSDPGKKVAKEYGVLALAGLYARRWTFYIDANGIIQYIDKSVDTKAAGPDIVKRLETLGFSKRSRD